MCADFFFTVDFKVYTASMIVFITSLKHPDTVASESTMIRLLERTLSTLEAQTDSDFRVIVVCHQIPQLSHTYPQAEFVLVDFPAPADNFESLSYSER